MAERRIQVLLVEDNPADGDLLQETMGLAGEALFEFYHANSLAAGLTRMAEGDIALVLLDLGLPDSQGLDTLSAVCRQAPDMPVLVMTGLDDEAVAVHAVQTGAQDYLVKGQAEGPALIRAIHYAIERKRAEVALRHTNRTLNIITGSNQALIRATEETELLQRICQIIVNVGGYPLAWIGFAEHNEAKSVRPVAAAGDSDGYLARSNFTWADTEAGQGSTGAAIRTGQPSLVRNILTDPRPLPWRDRARRRGYRCALSLPLMDKAEAFGAINIYAREPDAFPDAEVQLLMELAGDLAYGLLALRAQAERQAAQTALQASLVELEAMQTELHAQNEELLASRFALEAERQRFQELFDFAPDGYLATDPHGVILEANRAASLLLNRDRERLAGMPLAFFVAQADEPAFLSRLAEWQKAGAPDQAELELSVQPHDGAPFPAAITVGLTWDSAGRLTVLRWLLHDITVRKQAVEALRESKELFSSLYENATVGMYRTTPAGQILMANPTVVRLLGYDDFEDLAKRDLEQEGFEPDYSRSEFRHTLETQGDIAGLESVWKRKDGTSVFVRESARSVRGTDGKVLYYEGTVEDITERKLAEVALQQSRSNLAEAQRIAHLGSYEYDGPQDQLHWSDEGFRIFGISPQDFSGRSADFFDRIHPDDRRLVQETIDQAIATTGKGKIEYRIVRSDGMERIIQEEFQVTYEDGRRVRQNGTIQDITERKLAEAQFQNQYAILQGILRSTNDVVFSVDLNCRYTVFNPAHAALMKAMYGADIQVGQSLLDCMTVPGDRDEARSDIGRAMLGEQFSKETYTGDERRSRICMEVSHNPIRDEMGHVVGVAVFSKDISARKWAEEALMEERALLAQHVEERTQELSLANAALSRAARLKDEFLASMSHELRTPLTAILGLSETLQMGIYGALTDKQNEVLTAVYDSGQHLLGLINDILDLSKVEAGKMELQLERILVADVCLASVQFVKQSAQHKNLRLVTSLDARVTAISADGRRLKQILINLLSNAVKFTPDGGEIGLSVEGDPAHQLARFTVWDTGIGIAQADMRRLFQPFVQLDSRLAREYSGTGLGLSLVLRMAELHGGSVTVESDGVPGKGSRFTVTLPWNETDELPDASRPEVPVEMRLNLRHALTVEDTAVAAEQMTRCLTSLGIKNTVHPCGAGAFERVLDLRPDVVLLDILLPDVSGWEVLRQLKGDERTRNVPVIVASVVDDGPRAAALGADAYLVKPVGLSDLQNALRQSAERGGQLSAQSALVVGGANRPPILVADDNDTVVMTLGGFLKARDYTVVVAHNGAEAVASARQNRPGLILMDIQMPGVDGLEAIRRLRADPDAELAATPIIALTALAMPGDRERCLEAGANEYLAKPMNLAKLVDLMNKLLNGPETATTHPADPSSSSAG